MGTLVIHQPWIEEPAEGKQVEVYYNNNHSPLGIAVYELKLVKRFADQQTGLDFAKHLAENIQPKEGER